MRETGWPPIRCRR